MPGDSCIRSFKNSPVRLSFLPLPWGCQQYQHLGDTRGAQGRFSREALRRAELTSCMWLISGGVSVRNQCFLSMLRSVCTALPEHAPITPHREANAGRGVCEGRTDSPNLLPATAACSLAARSALPTCITQGCLIAQSNTDTELFLKFTVLNYL